MIFYAEYLSSQYNPGKKTVYQIKEGISAIGILGCFISYICWHLDASVTIGFWWLNGNKQLAVVTEYGTGSWYYSPACLECMYISSLVSWRTVQDISFQQICPNDKLVKRFQYFNINMFCKKYSSFHAVNLIPLDFTDFCIKAVLQQCNFINLRICIFETVHQMFLWELNCVNAYNPEKIVYTVTSWETFAKLGISMWKPW